MQKSHVISCPISEIPREYVYSLGNIAYFLGSHVLYIVKSYDPHGKTKTMTFK